MIALVVIVGVVLAVTFSLYLKSGEKAVVRTEVSYFIIALLLALPFLLLFLFIALATDKREITIERSEDVFPNHVSRSNKGTISPTFSVMISHLLYYADLLHKQSASLSV